MAGTGYGGSVGKRVVVSSMWVSVALVLWSPSWWVAGVHSR